MLSNSCYFLLAVYLYLRLRQDVPLYGGMLVLACGGICRHFILHNTVSSSSPPPPPQPPPPPATLHHTNNKSITLHHHTTNTQHTPLPHHHATNSQQTPLPLHHATNTQHTTPALHNTTNGRRSAPRHVTLQGIAARLLLFGVTRNSLRLSILCVTAVWGVVVALVAPQAAFVHYYNLEVGT